MRLGIAYVNTEMGLWGNIFRDRHPPMKTTRRTLHPFRIWRRTADLTLQAVAIKAGISVPTLCRIERGATDVTVPVAMRLSRLTGGAVKIEDFAP